MNNAITFKTDNYYFPSDINFKQDLSNLQGVDKISATNSIFSGLENQNYSFDKTLYTESTSSLSEELKQIKDEQGFIGKLWDGFKNLTGIGAGSNKTEKIIKDYESGLISEDEAKEAIEKYKKGQEMCVDIVGDMASGIIAVGSFVAAVPTGGASLAVGIGIAAGVGAGVKIGVKAGDAIVGGREYTGKDLLYDSVTGGINGVLAPVTNGIGASVTKSLGAKMGLTIVKEGTEEVIEQGVKQGLKTIICQQGVDVVGGTITKRAAALAAGMAVDGALSGAADNMTRAALNGDDIIEAGVQGAVGGLIMAPIIGGGFRLAGKAGRAISNSLASEADDAAAIQAQKVFSSQAVDAVDGTAQKQAIGEIQEDVSSLVSKNIQADERIIEAAARVTDDAAVQKGIAEIAQNESIIIRTKEDAIPILRSQYESLSDEARENLFVLNINPQSNNGMPKSNTLMSDWYAEANGIDPSKVITLNAGEMTSKPIQPVSICSEWKQGSKTAKDIQKRISKLNNNGNPMTLTEARNILSSIKGLNESEILAVASVDDIASAMQKINSELVTSFKNGGYTSSLSVQMKEAIQNADGKVTFVIPDDCSLSGSSILCDTARLVEKTLKGLDDTTQVEFVFSPMILGDKAEDVIGYFSAKQALTSEDFLRSINAIGVDGTEKFQNAVKVFESIQDMDNVTFSLANGSKKAQHFTQTETFRRLGETNPELQQKILYLMQGPIDGTGHLYGGFEDCGVMVITPTDAFEIDGITYAGKIPTNSVGFMEVLGHTMGVINDEVGDSKGLFTKGTGRKYMRYCEWDGLNIPSKVEDRIGIRVIDGKVIKANN